jgi:KDO2-lipid IV(A) lauroyltransferase
MIYLGYLLASVVVRLLPLGAACWIAERIADLWYGASPRLRATLDRNLSLIPALERPGPRAATARKVVRNFARVVTEFLYLPRINAGNLGRHVDLEDFRRLRQALGRKPVVFITGHLGNWELAAAAGALYGLDLHVVVFDHPDPRVAALFRKRREDKGLKVMSVASAARLLASVTGTSSVGIAGDRDFSGHGIEASFLGIPTRVPSAYAGLAILKHLPVVPVFCVKWSDGKYHLEMEPPLAIPDPADGDAAQVVSQYLNILEKYVVKYPEQWYRFDDLGT